MKRLLGKLSYSNVISTLCLLLLLSGGTAYAASKLGRESVGTRQLKKGAVTPTKLNKASKKALKGPRGGTGNQGPRGATGAQGPKGGTGARGAIGPRGPSNAYYAVNTPAETNAKSLSINVPPGSYVASGSMGALLLSENTPVEAECTLTGTGSPIEGGLSDQALVGPTAQTPIGYNTLHAEAGIIIGGAGGTITLKCKKGIEGDQAAQIDFYEARLIATRVEELTPSS